MKSFAKFLSIVFIGGLMAGCASDFAYVPQIPQHAQAKVLDYFEQPDQKVFVIAIDPSGDYAFGYEYGKKSLKEAATIAVEKCNANRESHRVVARPYIYAINNKVVYEEMIRKAHEEGGHSLTAQEQAQVDEAGRQEATGEANEATVE